MKIPEVSLLDLNIYEDDRGYLFEVVHRHDLHDDLFGQTYVVGDRTAGTVRAFHRHAVLWDYFSIIKGSAKFVLVSKNEEFDVVVLSDRKPRLLVVPPSVYHGWMSLEPDTILLSTGSHVYNRDNPDEDRVPPNQFDWLFGKSPWQIEAK